MEDNKPTQTTTVQEVEVSDDTLNEILGIPGAESVMVPSAEAKKPSIFSKDTVDTSFLEKDEEETTSKPVASTTPSTTTSVKETEAAIQEVTQQLNDILEEEADAGKSGRPRVDKSGLVETFSKLIEKGVILPFDEDKPLEKYSSQDFQELLEANLAEKEKTIREETPMEFFDSLPHELQYAAKYVADGGTDLKGLFRTLSQVQEMRELSVEDADDQEAIVRNYLSATNFGTPEEIEEEIDSWRDREELGSKAKKFKPKLDAMQEQIVARRLQQQEEMRKQQEHAARAYTDNIYKTLEPGELNGVKIDKKIQGLLFQGLVQPNYPSMSGRPTNLLGHLLEKYQYVQPRHDLIAEALWLLADPDGYKSKIKEGSVKETTEKTVRMLKTEQQSRQSSTTMGDTDDAPSPRKTKTISRQNSGNNFFKR
jgi:hypothetical protein